MTSSLPSRRAFDWRNLRVRLLSAALLVPLALAALVVGGWLWFVTLSVAVSLLAIEWGAMSAPRAPARAAAAVTVAVLAAVFVSYEHPLPAWGVLGLAALAVAVLSGRLSARLSDLPFGVLYIGAPVLALMWLRGGETGLGWTAMLFAVTWSADSAAFLVGNLVKGPRLQPLLSPKKTWSGLAGGILAAGAAGAVAADLFELPLSAAWGAVIGLAGGAATMAGDLVESAIKRRFGVKDSGALIPGHGGLLDRVDGLLFAAVVVAGARLVWAAGGGA